jgi:hypothetical protein
MINGERMRTCGNCAFARPLKTDRLQIECGGVPPTPVFFGMQPAKQAIVTERGVVFSESPQPVLKCVPPVLPKTFPACALYLAADVDPADDADSLHAG